MNPDAVLAYCAETRATMGSTLWACLRGWRSSERCRRQMPTISLNEHQAGVNVLLGDPQCASSVELHSDFWVMPTKSPGSKDVLKIFRGQRGVVYRGGGRARFTERKKKHGLGGASNWWRQVSTAAKAAQGGVAADNGEGAQGGSLNWRVAELKAWGRAAAGSDVVCD
eukprot:scaffold256881_cov19-Tisochrysis_lutea.AAC.3